MNANQIERRHLPNTVVGGIGGACDDEQMRAGVPTVAGFVKIFDTLHGGSSSPGRLHWHNGMMDDGALGP